MYLLLLHGWELRVLGVGVELCQFCAQRVGVGVGELNVRGVHLVVRIRTLLGEYVSWLSVCLLMN